MEVFSQSCVDSLVFLSVCLGSILPLLVTLDSFTWLFLGLWVVGGGVRFWYEDDGLRTDCAVFGAIGLVLGRERLWRYAKEMSTGLVVGRSWTETVVRAIPLVLFGIFCFLRRARNSKHAGSGSGYRREDLKEYEVETPKPLIFPCRTTHARLFPKRHAFGYSYLLYGIPIVPAGTNYVDFDFADGKDRRKGPWWLQVRADDYLLRGMGELGFYGKLKVTLMEHGVPDSDWSYAYLVTAPRFWGYSFNPVSFWYIYDRSHVLKKMILEVNNTFGERRVYLLDGSSPPTPPQSPEYELSASDVNDKRFTDLWEKDFHVSPFNSRKGSYALKAHNPFPSSGYQDVHIDNTITLKSSKDHAKVVARVHSTEPPLDAMNLGTWGTLRFVGGWWWVGLVTFPRILKEAYKLFSKRSLHVWFRPEVLPSSIGREPTVTDITLQKIFRDYLQHLVFHASEPWSITVHTAIPSQPKQMIMSTYIPGREIPCKELELRILTPAFYSRFVHYAHSSEAFDRECLFTDERNRTIWISNPELLHLLLSELRSKPSTDEIARTLIRSRMERFRWTVLKKLRCPPAEPAYPVTPQSAMFDTDDIRTLPFSDLETYVRSRRGYHISGLYRRTVTRVFLAQRFAFGFIEMVDLLDLLVRILVCYHGAASLLSWAAEAEKYGFHRRVEVIPGTCVGYIRGAQSEWWWLLGLGIKVCWCHLYALAKGYT